ncbi:hypothetical protein BGX23_010415 [Mortierella sp. AD031]|nr:hypothetical protein BGX23_010415 [Mortierella sp. AD031]
MPAPHRAFLDHLAKVANLRPYVLAKSASDPEGQDVQELVEIYDSCVHCIKLFRDNHIQIAWTPEGWEGYRVVKVENQPGGAAVKVEKKKFEAKKGETEGEMTMKGTSDLIPFLKCSRDETNAAMVVTPVKK